MEDSTKANVGPVGLAVFGLCWLTLGMWELFTSGRLLLTLGYVLLAAAFIVIAVRRRRKANITREASRTASIRNHEL